MAFINTNEEIEEPRGKHAKHAAPAEPTLVPEQEFSFAAESGVEMPKDHSGLVKRVLLILGGVILALLVIVYGIGVFYFSDRFFPNTTLDKSDISMKASVDLERMLSSVESGYSLKIDGDEFSMTLSGADIKFNFDKDEMNKRILESKNAWAWPVEVFRSHDLTDVMQANYDKAAAQALLKPEIDKHNETAKPTEDATIAYNKDKNSFAVKAEVYGTKLHEDAVYAAVDKVVTKADSKLTLGHAEVDQPTIFSDDKRLETAAQQASEMVKADITLMLGENEAAHVTAEISSAWVTLSPEFTVALDTAAMEAWVEGIATAFDTVGSERTYTRPDGKECTVTGGDYGWKVDHEALIELVSKDMAAGVTVVEDVSIESEAQAFNGIGKADWGPRYLDVDLDEQHVYFYDSDGSLIWESDCVSGAPTKDRATPQGVYDVNLKESPSTLVGYRSNGEKDYETKVAYWMPFKGNSVGFHDASWQGGFGGERYRNGSGSHGCVNLPVSAAQELYDLIKVGDVVVVHE